MCLCRSVCLSVHKIKPKGHKIAKLGKQIVHQDTSPTKGQRSRLGLWLGLGDRVAGVIELCTSIECFSSLSYIFHSLTLDQWCLVHHSKDLRLDVSAIEFHSAMQTAVYIMCLIVSFTDADFTITISFFLFQASVF